jgi:hypothetical protein
VRFPGFVGPSYQAQSKNIDCERCINLYAELTESGKGKEGEVAALVGTPGLSLLLTLAGGAVREIFTASNDEVYAVGGNKLYRISSTWVATELGTLNTAAGPVSMADNGLQLVIVDGGYGYQWTFLTSTFAQITDEDFPGATQVTYQDGYFIFCKPFSQQFFISDLSDTAIDGLDFASSEGNPDLLVGVLSDHRDLWLFNKKTAEVFNNTGNADFPFERNASAFIEHGCAAPFSIQKMNNSVFWLGQDDKGFGIVYMASSYTPQRISTHAVETAIQSYENIADARAWTYQERGHHFYVLNFPTANTTWVFDSATGLWHERVFTYQGRFQRHRGDSHAVGFGKHLVGDYANGKIYELTSSVYSDDGAAITRRRVSPHVTAGLAQVFYLSFELDIEMGVGLDGVAQGTNPQVMLRFSKDGGHTWSNEIWKDVGKIGNRHNRARWTRLGQSRDRVFEVTITDPVKVTILGAEIELEKAAA